MSETVFRYSSEGVPWAPKDARACLDYSLLWTNWLTGGESIASSTWTATGASTITIATTFISGARTTAYVSGGVAGETVTIRNWVQTSSSPPRQEARYFELHVVDRVAD